MVKIHEGYSFIHVAPNINISCEKITINHKASFSLLSHGQHAHSSLIKRDRDRQSVVVVIGNGVPIAIAGGRLRQIERSQKASLDPENYEAGKIFGCQWAAFLECF